MIEITLQAIFSFDEKRNIFFENSLFLSAIMDFEINFRKKIFCQKLANSPYFPKCIYFLKTTNPIKRYV